MNAREEIIKKVMAALELDPWIDLHHRPVDLDFSEGVLTLTGEMDNVAAKKLALELAGAVPGVAGIVDRLRVAPAEPMEDGAVRDHVLDLLMQEPVFGDYVIRALVKGETETLREELRSAAGEIEIEVNDGVVVLNGRTGSLSHKRLAGVLAWWVPGSRDVVNGLEVVPPMDDNDDEVVDARPPRAGEGPLRECLPDPGDVPRLRGDPRRGGPRARRAGHGGNRRMVRVPGEPRHQQHYRCRIGENLLCNKDIQDNQDVIPSSFLQCYGFLS